MAIVLVPQALCSVEDVKQQLGDAEMSSANDVIIAMLINGFALGAEGYCNRPFEIKSRTDYFDTTLAGGPGGPSRMLQLPAYPLTTATVAVYDDPAQLFGADSLLEEGVDYVVDRVAGMVTKTGALVYEAGALLSLGNARPYFAGGPHSVKVVSTGGLVVPRPAGPAVPTTVASGTGLSGQYRHVVTTVDANGVESCASVASVALTLVDQGAAVTFANPGVGASTRIYRTNETGIDAKFYYSGQVAGDAGGAQTYTDTVADDALDLDRQPPAAGPLTVDDGLRTAAMMQVIDWFNRRKRPGEAQVVATGQGNVVYAHRDKNPYLPMVQSILDGFLS